MKSGFCLSPELFSTLFPFHLVIDRNLIVTQVGPILNRVFPCILTDDSKFQEHFRIRLPNILMNFDEIRSNLQEVFWLVSRHNGVKLKGQMVDIDLDTILFLGSPVIRDVTKIDRLGLKLDDFLTYDLTADLMFQLEMQNIALAEAKQKAELLAEKQVEIHQKLVKEQELNELKTRFINTASHEFRTPLGIISSSAGLLEDYDSKLDVTKKRKHFKQIQDSVKHMTTLLEDILLINQTDAGKLECKKSQLDLISFCQELVDELVISKNAEHRLAMNITCLNQNVDLDDGFPVCIDAKLVRQILTNLLSNGIKYSFPESQVQFEIQIERGTVTFHVRDRGIGISKTDRSSLFEAFHRGSNVNNIQGTGLGLSIVKRCVDLHGGTIRMTSEVDVGSTFTVTLPIDDFGHIPSDPLSSAQLILN
jgi:signal transduction histidine kinase